MEHDRNGRPGVLPLFGHAATAMAVARVGLGLTALIRPALVARPWVGSSADELGGQVLGRALGARDLALGLGALAARRSSAAGPQSAGAWYAAGALSDAIDATITAAAWPRLPRATRWLVGVSAAGAAMVGVGGMLATVVELRCRGVSHRAGTRAGRRRAPRRNSSVGAAWSGAMPAAARASALKARAARLSRYDTPWAAMSKRPAACHPRS